MGVTTCGNDITFETKKQLQEYFAKAREIFDLPLELKGSDFQISVWKELTKISFGRTCSYADISRAIGKPLAYRAVGSANGLNLLPIIIPCHRVIGSNGKLAGYASGITKKAWLLRHEESQFEN